MEMIDIYFRILDVSPDEFIHQVVIQDLRVDSSKIIVSGVVFSLDGYNPVSSSFQLEVLVEAHVTVLSHSHPEVYRTFPVIGGQYIQYH